MSKKAIIIGAGPAGLSTAYQLLIKTDIVPVILERSANIKSMFEKASYTTHRMDLGLHRILSRLSNLFFTTKSSVSSCEQVAWQVQEMGGNIHFHHHIYATYTVGKEVCSIHTINARTGELALFQGDYFFSSLSARQLLTLAPVEKYNNLFIIGNRKPDNHILKTLS